MWCKRIAGVCTIREGYEEHAPAQEHHVQEFTKAVSYRSLCLDTRIQVMAFEEAAGAACDMTVMSASQSPAAACSGAKSYQACLSRYRVLQHLLGPQSL